MDICSASTKYFWHFGQPRGKTLRFLLCVIEHYYFQPFCDRIRLEQHQWHWSKVSSYISLIHLGKATPNQESDLKYMATQQSGLNHSWRQKTNSPHTQKSLAGLHFIYKALGREPWLILLLLAATGGCTAISYSIMYRLKPRNEEEEKVCKSLILCKGR